MLDNGANMLEIADKHFGSFVRYHRGIRQYNDMVSARRNLLRNVQVIVCIGPAGSGKSTWAMTNYPEAYWVPPIVNGNLWLDGYIGQKEVIIDDLTWFPLGILLRILDRFPLLAPAKGHHVPFQAQTIVMTSTQNLTTFWPRRPPDRDWETTLDRQL